MEYIIDTQDDGGEIVIGFDDKGLITKGKHDLDSINAGEYTLFDPETRKSVGTLYVLADVIEVSLEQHSFKLTYPSAE